jgi:hypothetical protein
MNESKYVLSPVRCLTIYFNFTNPTQTLQTTPANNSTMRYSSKLLRRVLHVFRKEEEEEQPKRFDTIGGVYATEIGDADEKQSSFKSLSTVDTRSSDSTSTGSCSWHSSGAADHHKGAPLIARKSIRHLNPSGIELGDEELLGRIMLKSRQLPNYCWYLCSNHIMINNERAKRIIAPLQRVPYIDELARGQATLMAADSKLFHTDPTDLQEKLGRQSGRRVGENVASGPNLQVIHNKLMMQSVADKNNILDRRFTLMGIGTAKATDGTLYLCQIFSH